MSSFTERTGSEGCAVNRKGAVANKETLSAGHAAELGRLSLQLQFAESQVQQQQAKLLALQEEERVLIDGPFGNFTLDENNKETFENVYQP